MAKNELQQKLSTEPKGTVQEIIQFAIPDKKGEMRKQSFDKMENINTTTDEVHPVM